MKNEILKLAKELCQFSTGVVADENIGLFKRIEKEIELKYIEFKSGSTFNGWLVPKNWRVKKANIFKDGKLLFNAALNHIGVARYSKSFSGRMSLTELKRHLVTNPNLPNSTIFHCAWQYRPWDADWAISMPYKVFKRLSSGFYDIELITEYSNGKMIVAYCDIKGKSNKTIIFNTNNCHPKMANDGFAGTAVLIRLFQWLKKRKNFYSYKLIIAPEHLGSIFFLSSLKKKELKNMVCGIFEEMPGNNANAKVTKTFNGDHIIDEAFKNIFRTKYKKSEIVEWRKGAGNDETVWESPGYEIPFVELTRCENQFEPFKYYHTDHDTVENLSDKKVGEFLMILQDVIDILENDQKIFRKFDGLLCLSNPKFNLYKERKDPAIEKNLGDDSEKWGHLLDCLLRYFNGKHSILEIANIHDLYFKDLYDYILEFKKKNLVRLVFNEIEKKEIKSFKKI